jgi:hypothetical protein
MSRTAQHRLTPSRVGIALDSGKWLPVGMDIANQGNRVRAEVVNIASTRTPPARALPYPPRSNAPAC